MMSGSCAMSFCIVARSFEAFARTRARTTSSGPLGPAARPFVVAHSSNAATESTRGQSRSLRKAHTHSAVTRPMHRCVLFSLLGGNRWNVSVVGYTAPAILVKCFSREDGSGVRNDTFPSQKQPNSATRRTAAINQARQVHERTTPRVRTPGRRGSQPRPLYYQLRHGRSLPE